MLPLIWHWNALPDISPSALWSYPPLVLKNAWSDWGYWNMLLRDVGNHYPWSYLKNMQRWCPGTGFSGGHGNARLIVGLDILVVFSSLDDTVVLWCFYSKCLQNLSVCRWSLWLWHCWQINTISEAKNKQKQKKKPETKHQKKKQNPTHKNKTWWLWMDAWKMWEYAKLYIFPKNILVCICLGSFLNNLFLSG